MTVPSAKRFASAAVRFASTAVLAVALTLPLAALASVVDGIVTTSPISASFCSLNSLGSAVAISTCPVPSGAICAYITATGANLNWRDDGVPTSTVGTGGQQLSAGSAMWYCGSLLNLQLVQQSANGVASVSFYK
jgi:hypothetical protein